MLVKCLLDDDYLKLFYNNELHYFYVKLIELWHGFCLSFSCAWQIEIAGLGIAVPSMAPPGYLIFLLVPFAKRGMFCKGDINRPVEERRL
jgi:hypothetical protein